MKCVRVTADLLLIACIKEAPTLVTNVCVQLSTAACTAEIVKNLFERYNG